MRYKHNGFFGILNMLAIAACMLTSCNHGYKNPKPDISHIPETKIELVRLEKLLFTAGPENYNQVYDQIRTQHPDIFQSLTENFWGLTVSDSLPLQKVYDSLYANTAGNQWMRQLYDSCMLMYDKMDDVEASLSEAFRYYRYYFPDSALPQLYTYTGPFVYWTMFDSATLGIELDMHLGPHFGYYGSYESNMPLYITIRCDKPYIQTNVMQSLVDGVVPSWGADATVLDEMLRYGKILYYLDCVLPDVPDSIKMGYTDAQIEWCYDNESEIWKFLAGEDLLFSKRTDDMRRYLGEAPNSQGMPEESPGRAAIWTGWQIIRTYMEENPDITLSELFLQMDAMRILKDADYNPED